MNLTKLMENGFSPGKRLLAGLATALALTLSASTAFALLFPGPTLPADAEYSQPRLAPNPDGHAWANVAPNALADYFTYVPFSNADATALGFPGSCGNLALTGSPADQASTDDCYTITVKDFNQSLALPVGWGFGGPGLIDAAGTSTPTYVYGYGSGGQSWTPPQFFFDANNGNAITKKTVGLATVTGNAPTLFATPNATLTPPIAGNGIWHFPAPSIKGTKGRPIRVQWLNELPNKVVPGLDPTVDCSDSSPDCFPYNRIVTHVHGAHVGPASDGLTQGEYNPDFSHKGVKFPQTVLAPLEGPPGTYLYPMDQEAATIWYHDHAAGSTHLNTNMGMAGFFPITDANEKCLQGIGAGCTTKYLPTGSADSSFKDSAYELGLALQDRVFYTNGQLAMPDAPVIDGSFPGCDSSSPALRLATCSPLFMYTKHAANADSLTPAGIHMIPYNETNIDMTIPENSQAPLLATSATLEFFGNIPVVNGVVYGTHDVEPRVYRMRLLNGTDSRTWDLKLEAYNGATYLGLIPFWQIGTEQGFLNNPTSRDDVLIMPGERVDVLVDFNTAKNTTYPAMNRVMLANHGTDAPYQGELLTPFNRSADIPDIMQFNLVALNSGRTLPTPEVSVLPSAAINLRPTSAITPMTATLNVPIRKIALEEIVDEYQRIMPTIDRRGYDLPGMPATEIVRLYDTEVWDLINTTADAHPMHLHQVAFQIVYRQPFTSFTPANNINGVFSQPNYTADPGTEIFPDPAGFDAGLKDTVYTPPGLVTRVIAYFDILGEYVWHCHILSHEEHDMMRPLKIVAANLNAPTALAFATTTPNDRSISVTVTPPVSNPVTAKYYVEYKKTTDTNWTTNYLGSGTIQPFTFPSDGTYQVRAKSVDVAISPTYGDSAYFTSLNTVFVGPSDAITSPAPGTTLTGTSVLFQFTNPGSFPHTIWVGTTAGAKDVAIVSVPALSNQATISSLPSNGGTLYVRLFVKDTSVVPNVMRYRDFTYTAYTWTGGQMVLNSFVGPNGTITPSANVNYGSNKTFTATPSAGYYVQRVRIDGADQAGPFASPYNYTFTNVTAPHIISVNFAANPVISSYISAGGGGTITPTTAVQYGGSQSFNAVADSSHYIQNVKVDGVNQVGPFFSPYIYTFNNVIAAHTITVTFALKPSFAVNSYIGAGGTITPSAAVLYGGSKTFTATANAGFYVQRVRIDGVDQTGPFATPYNYTFTNVTAPHTISVNFAANPVISSYISAAAGGTITPSTAVQYGANQTFTATADASYFIYNVKVDGVNQPGPFLSPYNYTFNNVTAAHTITVTFAVKPSFAVNSFVGAGGTITPSAAVLYGDSKAFTATANAGFYVQRVRLDGVDQAGPFTTPYNYTFTNVTAPHTISVNFAANPVISSYIAAGGGGTITPTTAVQYGGTQTFTATADAGKFVQRVRIDGVDQTGPFTSPYDYNFTNVTAPHVITVNFGTL